MSSVTQKNPVRVFVAHVWEKDDDYLRIFEYLESASNFYYRNTSTPEVRPSGDKEALRESLRNQITEAEVVMVPAALYRRAMDWVEFQMHCARQRLEQSDAAVEAEIGFDGTCCQSFLKCLMCAACPCCRRASTGDNAPHEQRRNE